ncbi:MAG: flagellar basal-body MS-ring/collar protein FliF [Bacillota bacterium]
MASVGSDLIGRLKKVWDGSSPTMRWLSAGLLVALVFSLGVTWYLGRPQWEVFFKANDPSEVTGLTGRLDELKVQYRLAGDGMTILVPTSERSAANLAKAQAGLPSGGHVGLEIFAEPKFGATEFDKKVNYERAIEGELARALMRLGDIQYATVNLNLPERSVFVRDRQQPTASVLVQPRLGRNLSKENVLSIVNFVASSVDGLAPEKVTVINDKGVLLSKGLDQLGQTAGMDAEALAQQRQREQQLTEKVMSVLEPIFGIGNVAATVTVEFDTVTTRIEETIVGQAVPKSTVTERTGSQSQGTNTGNGANADPATPATPANPTTPPPVYQATQTESNSDNFSSKTATQYEVGQKNQVTVSPAGSVKRVSTAVTINREELTGAQIDQIRQLAASATGATMTDVSVLAMSFTPAATQVVSPTPQPTSPLDPKTLAIGLGIASFFLILAFFLTRRRRPEPEFALAGVPGHHPATGTTLDVALGLEQGGAPSRHQAAAASGEPVLAGVAAGAGQAESGPEQTPAQKLEQVLKKRKPKRQPLDVEDFLDDDALADIDVLIEQAPEACAEVIRQWLKGGL